MNRTRILKVGGAVVLGLIAIDLVATVATVALGAELLVK